MAAQKLMGGSQPEAVTAEAPAGQIETINKKAIEKAAETLKKYKEGKRKLEERIVEEEQWWKLRHWDVIGKGKIFCAGVTII